MVDHRCEIARTRDGETARFALDPGGEVGPGLPNCMLDVISEVSTMGDGTIVPTLPEVMVATPNPVMLPVKDPADDACVCDAVGFELGVVVDTMLPGGASREDTLKVSSMLKSSVKAKMSKEAEPPPAPM